MARAGAFTMLNTGARAVTDSGETRGSRPMKTSAFDTSEHCLNKKAVGKRVPLHAALPAGSKKNHCPPHLPGVVCFFKRVALVIEAGTRVRTGFDWDDSSAV